MTNIIEKIEDIEVTDEMLKSHYEGAGKTKTGMPVIYTVSDSIKRAIQASTQIADLIAENKRLREEKSKQYTDAYVNQLIKDNLELTKLIKEMTTVSECTDKSYLFICKCPECGYVSKHQSKLPQPPTEKNND